MWFTHVVLEIIPDPIPVKQLNMIDAAACILNWYNNEGINEPQIPNIKQPIKNESRYGDKTKQLNWSKPTYSIETTLPHINTEPSKTYNNATINMQKRQTSTTTTTQVI